MGWNHLSGASFVASSRPGREEGYVVASKDGKSTERRIRSLVVEDAPEYRELLAGQLVAEGFEVETAQSGRAAVELAHTFDPHVIVLDLGLPDMDGLEVCRQIRMFCAAYVVMLTGRDDEVDKLVGLSVGADDYMTKPFSSRELVARIRAMLRRPRGSVGADPASAKTRRIGGLTVDPETREVHIGGTVVELTRIEFDLLDVLTERPKVVFTRTQLLERVWGENWIGDDHVVDVHMSSLRRKLEDDPRKPTYIGTVRGVGYRFAGS